MDQTDLKALRMLVAALVMRQSADTDEQRTHNASEALKSADALFALVQEEDTRLARTVDANRQLVEQLHEAHQRNAEMSAQLAQLQPAPEAPAEPAPEAPAKTEA